MIGSLVRKLVIKGRSAVGWFSSDGWPTAPDEPETQTTALRAQHYGLTTEPPDGAECVALGVNGGSDNLVSVAERVEGEPQIETGEVLLWCKFGQRLLLNKDGDVVVLPAAGRDVLLGDGSPGACDKLVTESKLQTILNTIKGHTHPASMGTTSASTELAVVGAVTISGSPNVKAKVP